MKVCTERAIISSSRVAPQVSFIPVPAITIVGAVFLLLLEKIKYKYQQTTKGLKTMKKIVILILTLAMIFAVVSCGETSQNDGKTYTVGICNYVDDASLNQIVDNIRSQLAAIGRANGVTFKIKYDNCNADSNVLNQIIQNFIADKVDLMIGVATPVAMAMQSATEDTNIPVVFAAVSDPEGTDLVSSNAAPGANITGTSDYLDTNAVMNLIFALDPDADNVALLYDLGQDASTTAIAQAKAYLSAKGVAYKEYTGTNVSEIQLAVDSLIADGVDAVFTPSDNTVMTAELSIYDKLADAKIPHYCGADSFALNGAFLGYGVDYANLGVETANIVSKILLDKADPATTPVMTFDNGTATVNTEICEKLGLSYDDVANKLAPHCTKVQPITTSESFD